MDKILEYYKEYKDILAWLFGSGVILLVVRFFVWLVKEFKFRRIRTSDSFPFKVIPSNSNVGKEILGGADDDPLADRNIPYQHRVRGRNIRHELEEEIEESRCLLITGKTGLGKTREAVHLAQSLANEGWTILFLTREGWLDAPAKLPNNVPDRKLLFFIDDINKKCHSGKVEIRPDVNESFTLPVHEPFQIRLERTLNAFEIFCGKSEIRVIATARNEKTSDFDEPSEWDKLAWKKYESLWEKFTLVELPQPDKAAEERLLVETTGHAGVEIKIDDVPVLANRNDGTFRNLVENISSSRAEGDVLSAENFRDTLKGTWEKRYQKAIRKFPEAKYVYDAVELIRLADLDLVYSNVVNVALILFPAKGIEKIKFILKCPFIVKQLENTEDILKPRDEQVEAKGYQVSLDAHIRKLYAQFHKKYHLLFPTLSSRMYAYTWLAPRAYFLAPEINLIMKFFSSISLASFDLLNVGTAYMTFGYSKDALFFLERSIKLGEEEIWHLFTKRGLASNWAEKGRAHAYMRQYDEAITACRKAIELNKKSYLAWRNLGIIYEEMEQFDSGIAAYSKALEIEPKASFTWKRLGSIYSRIKKHDETINAFEQVVKLEPKSESAWMSLSQAYYSAAKLYEARRCCEKAIQLNPKFVIAWNLLGLICRTLKLKDEAINAYKKAIELDSTYGDAWYMLAGVYYFEGEFETALPFVEKAIELSPDVGLYHAGFISVLYRVGRSAEAVEHEKITRPLMQTEDEYNRACFESVVGNKDEAVRLLSIALEKGETDLDMIREDRDFDNIRNDEGFRKLSEPQ